MKQNFELVGDFEEGFARIKLSDDTWNFIDDKGNLLLKENFKNVEDFQEGFAIVQLLNNTWNFIDTKGNLLSKEQNFKNVYSFNDGFAEVQLSDNNWNFIDKEGNLLSKEQNFKWVDEFYYEGFAEVQLLDGTWNYIDRQGNLLSKEQNFKDVYSFRNGFAEVQLLDGKEYYIDKQLNFYDYKTKTPVPNPFNETLDENIVRLANFYDIKLEPKSKLENIDLSELERRLDKAIDKESSKELITWINSQKGVKLNKQSKNTMSLDLNELERRLDEALEKETPKSLIAWLNTQRTMNVIKSSEWKVGTCSQGESCWCRTILLKNEKLDFEGEPIYVVASGTLNKEIAEYLVNLHNEVINRM